MSAKDSRIPVTILTGFLGAGKTTLLNELTQRNPTKKIAIIENEFGEIGIDNDLLIRPANGIVELSNGCICCTLNDELVEALQRLLGSDYDFDHLLVETTGIAEPDGVAEAFLATPEIQQYFRVDSVVAVADAHFVVDILEEREEAKKQLTFADFILINKASEVSLGHLQDIQRLLKQINPLARIETADYCKTDADILTLQAYSAANLEKSITKETKKHEHKHEHKHTHKHEHAHEHKHGEKDHVCDEHCDHEHHHHEHKHGEKDHVCDEHCDHEHHHEHKHGEEGHVCDEHCDHEHHHHSDINSVSFVFDEPFDLIKFRHWLGVVLLIQNQQIYRIKGIINFAWEEHRMVVQSVQQLFQFQYGSLWGETEKRQSRIVFIGKNLKKPVLEKSLQLCRYNPDDFE